MDLEKAWFILEHGSGDGIAEYLKAINLIKKECKPVKHGIWVHRSLCNYDKCSVCGYTTRAYEDGSYYCPQCGSKMDGGVE